MDMTPEMVEAIGKAAVGVIAAFGAIVATVTSAVAAFYTWKNRYELDKLYAATYRPNADGTPGPMRSHPPALVKMFCRTLPVSQTVAAENNSSNGSDSKTKPPESEVKPP